MIIDVYTKFAILRGFSMDNFFNLTGFFRWVPGPPLRFDAVQDLSVDHGGSGSNRWIREPTITGIDWDFKIGYDDVIIATHKYSVV